MVAMLKGTVNFGYIPPDIELPLLLGAIAFAGAGGSMNLAQSDFVRDKGYGMGRFIGRITSPLTGEEEVVADIGYHFEQTEENMGRWKAWWRAANLEHIVSFYVLAVLSLILLSLISYSTSRGATELGTGFDFVRAEGIYIGEHFGIGFQRLFNWMGIAILLTTELGVVDACARISTGIIKVNWLRDNERWTDSRLYFALLWAQILLGCLIMLSDLNQPLGAPRPQRVHEWRCDVALFGAVVVDQQAGTQRQDRDGSSAFSHHALGVGIFRLFHLDHPDTPTAKTLELIRWTDFLGSAR